VLELEDATLKAGDRTLIADAELWLERGEHVSLVGANGSGKTTLVETLAGSRELERGKLRRGHNVHLGYLSQHTEVAGAGETTVLAHAQHVTGLSEAKTRALLGRFLFSDDDVFKLLGQLSGGEAQRLALALLTNSDANLLILDEPTNHLDVESREALEDALTGFAGSVLLISHDRALLEAVGSRTIVIEDGQLISHPGGWAEYRARAEAEREDGKPPVKKARSSRRSGPSKNARAALAKLEREVEQAEAAFNRIEDELADPSRWSDPDRSAKSTARHDRAQQRLTDAMARWEAAAEKAER
jgi:ATP-binding cassette subfamily F protein 3